MNKILVVLNVVGTAVCFASSGMLAKEKMSFKRLQHENGDEFLISKTRASTSIPKIRNFFDKISYSWVGKVIEKGNNRTLQLEDLWT
jgi:hypothetical protein